MWTEFSTHCLNFPNTNPFDSQVEDDSLQTDMEVISYAECYSSDSDTWCEDASN